MSKRKKFYERLKTIPNDIQFVELENFLKAQGFDIKSGNGSHMKFIYNEIMYVIPNHGLVEECYIQKVVQIIEENDIKIR